MEEVIDYNEDYIQYETAIIAKEKGFYYPVTHFWYMHGNSKKEKLENIYVETCSCNYECDFGACSIQPENFNDKEYGKTHYSAPTQDELAKWLRKNYDLYVTVHPTISGYCAFIENKPTDRVQSKEERQNSEWVNTDKNPIKNYEEAYELGLFKALMMIK